jgi:hypothetical protein
VITYFGRNTRVIYFTPCFTCKADNLCCNEDEVIRLRLQELRDTRVEQREWRLSDKKESFLNAAQF